MKIFSENLKRFRTHYRLNQEKLAALIDTGRGSITNYERGENMPGYQTMDMLCKISGFSFKEWTESVLTFKGPLKIENDRQENADDPAMDKALYVQSEMLRITTDLRKADMAQEVKINDLKNEIAELKGMVKVLQEMVLRSNA